MAHPVSPGQLSLLDLGPLSPEPEPEVLSLAVQPERPGGLSTAVAGAISARRSDATRRACSGQWR
jgi:hypothetical protein